MRINEEKKKLSSFKRKRRNLLYQPLSIKNKNQLLSNLQRMRTKVAKRMIILKKNINQRSQSRIEKVINKEHEIWKGKKYKEMKKGEKKMSEE